MRRFLLLLLLSLSLNCFGQLKAKAISYRLQADLNTLSPAYGEQYDGKTPECSFEVDCYFTDQKLKTVVRTVKSPEDFPLTIRQRLYDLSSKDEYNIDVEQRILVHKKNQQVKVTGTGNKKTVMGHECREYILTDHRGVTMNLWVAENLDKNISPVGNFGIKGTALEIVTSNGLHYVATDFANGELDAAFFDIPSGFNTEVLDLTSSKK